MKDLQSILLNEYHLLEREYNSLKNENIKDYHKINVVLAKQITILRIANKMEISLNLTTKERLKN